MAPERSLVNGNFFTEEPHRAGADRVALARRQTVPGHSRYEPLRHTHNVGGSSKCSNSAGKDNSIIRSAGRGWSDKSKKVFSTGRGPKRGKLDARRKVIGIRWHKHQTHRCRWSERELSGRGSRGGNSQVFCLR